jgi:purine-binding chemotaxis protein CheW
MQPALQRVGVRADFEVYRERRQRWTGADRLMEFSMNAEEPASSPPVLKDMTDTVDLAELPTLCLPHNLGDDAASIPARPRVSLICQVRSGVVCALPLEHVDETMRPLAVTPMAGLPAFVEGLTVVRGVPTPVVNVASLLDGVTSHATRFVSVRAGARRIVLAVDAVVGVVEIPSGLAVALPLLLQNARLDAISAIGVLDADLLLVLRSSHLIPVDVWVTIQAGSTAA